MALLQEKLELLGHFCCWRWEVLQQFLITRCEINLSVDTWSLEDVSHLPDESWILFHSIVFSVLKCRMQLLQEKPLAVAFQVRYFAEFCCRGLLKVGGGNPGYWRGGQRRTCVSRRASSCLLWVWYCTDGDSCHQGFFLLFLTLHFWKGACEQMRKHCDEGNETEDEEKGSGIPVITTDMTLNRICFLYDRSIIL